MHNIFLVIWNNLSTCVTKITGSVTLDTGDYYLNQFLTQMLCPTEYELEKTTTIDQRSSLLDKRLFVQWNSKCPFALDDEDVYFCCKE